MAEDETDLIGALDAIEVRKGPGPMTCRWWATASADLRQAVTRNVAAKGHTAVAKALKDNNQDVTPPGIKEHAAGTCSCQKTS